MQDRAHPVVAGDENGDGAQAIVEHRHAGFEEGLELHSQLGERATGDDGNALVDP